MLVSGGGGGPVGIMENRFSKMISTWRQIVLQMENGIRYNDAMWNAFSFAYIEEDQLGLMTGVGVTDAEMKMEMQKIITGCCQGLSDTVIGSFTEKPM